METESQMFSGRRIEVENVPALSLSLLRFNGIKEVNTIIKSSNDISYIS